MSSNIQVSAKGSTAQVDILDTIHPMLGTAKGVIDGVKAAGDVKVIDLNINSRGGEVLDGLAIYHFLQQHPARVHARVLGVAGSIASVILMAGDTIEMPENAFLFVHLPWSGLAGNKDDLREQADFLEKLERSLVAAYRRHSSLSDAEILQLMKDNTWMTGPEAKEKGLCTTVTAAVKAAAEVDVNHLPNVPEGVRALFAQEESPPLPAALCKHRGMAYQGDDACPFGQHEPSDHDLSQELLLARIADPAANAATAAAFRNQHLTVLAASK